MIEMPEGYTTRRFISALIGTMILVALVGCGKSDDSDDVNRKQIGVTCGNGVLESGEECDGDDFGSASCIGLGFDGGSLSCSSSCVIDDSHCMTAPLPTPVPTATPAPHQATINNTLSAGQEMTVDLAAAAGSIYTNFILIDAPDPSVALGDILDFDSTLGTFRYLAGTDDAGSEIYHFLASDGAGQERQIELTMNVDAIDFAQTWTISNITGRDQCASYGFRCDDVEFTISQSATELTFSQRFYQCTRTDQYNTPMNDQISPARTFELTGEIMRLPGSTTIVGFLKAGRIDFSKCPSSGHCEQTYLRSQPGSIFYRDVLSIWKGECFEVEGTMSF